MALSVTVTNRNVAGNLRIHTGTMSFDSSYPTGGEPITPADVGFGSTIQDMQIRPLGAALGYNFSFDRVNLKVLAFRTDQVDDPEEEAPDTTNLSTLTGVQWMAWGN